MRVSAIAPLHAVKTVNIEVDINLLPKDTPFEWLGAI